MQTFQALLKHILLQSISANVNSVVIFVLQVENAGVHILDLSLDCVRYNSNSVCLIRVYFVLTIE